MLFNYDSMPIVVVSAIVGGVLTYTFLNIWNYPTTNSLNESLVDTLPQLESNIKVDNLPTHGYVDAAVQTESKSLFQSFKDWLRDVFSINETEVGTFGHDGVENWRNKIDSMQSLDLHDSESPLTKIGNTSPNLENLILPADSASQVSEVISESSLNIPSNSVYDINIYNQEFLYESLNNVSNYINNSYIIDGVTHTVLVIGDKILTVDPNIVINPFIC